MQRIELNDIRIDMALNVREGKVDQRVVELYKDNLSAIIAEKPVRVMKIDGAITLVDGFHRVAAAHKSGWDSIDCIVEHGDSMESAYLRAVSANTSHGHPLSPEQREIALKKILTTYPQYSDRSIAKIVGFSGNTVGRRRKMMEHQGKIKKTDSREGADGKEYTSPVMNNSVKGGTNGLRHSFVLRFPSVRVRDYFLKTVELGKKVSGTESLIGSLMFVFAEFHATYTAKDSIHDETILELAKVDPSAEYLPDAPDDGDFL